ncbi:HNH endonuclease family protein [Streptomyces axinellae]
MTRGLLTAALTLPLLTAAAPAVAEPAPQHIDLPVQRAIDSLPLATENRTGYKRTSFRHWIDADRDGCNTRQEVLIAEATEAPTVGPGCTLTGGRWHSYYEDADTDNARGLDIDHMVPLAEAWDSGASGWDAKKRERYANDLGSERSLVAVTAKYNRQKADKDPSDWWVPSHRASCQYLADWVATKTRWKLAIDQKEKTALDGRAVQCPTTKVSTDIAD